MNCPCCNICEPHPHSAMAARGYCFFMGPYGGYTDVTTPDGKAWYDCEVERARNKSYDDNS